MRSIKFILILVINIILSVNISNAQTVVFGDPLIDSMATAITGLSVNGVDYDVNFIWREPSQLYGGYPGNYTFTTESEAEDAIDQINAALNNASALRVGQAGSSPLEIYGIGFEGVTPVSVEQCKLTRGRLDLSWERAGTDFTFYNTDPRLFAEFLIATDLDDYDNQIYSYELMANYPNPFNPSTNIEFSLPVGAFVKLTVFDALGQEVEILINRYLSPAHHVVNYNASQLSSGVYFYRIVAIANDGVKFTSVRKMILSK